MIQKTVQCPNCNKILASYGHPGEVVKIICPECRTEGKVTFKKTIAKEDIAIEVTNLKKTYDDVVAVDDISFSIKQGEVFAFLGPNGAGKTTTVEIIESIREQLQVVLRFLV